MKPSLKLHVPSIRETDARRAWLADPETMSYNAGMDIEAEGYDRATGCIDFPPADWRYWRGVWLWQEPERYSAYLMREEDGAFVGEVCYYYDAESDTHGTGVLIAAPYRGLGYGTEGLRLLSEHAFMHPEVQTLAVTLPLTRENAIRMYLTNGFAVAADDGETVLLRKQLDGAAPQ